MRSRQGDGRDLTDLAKTASHEYRPPMSDLVVHSTPEFDPGYNVRTTLLRAAFGPEKPPPDIHLRLITWSRAAATNTLKARSEEHTSELQSLMRISYAGFCLKKKQKNKTTHTIH